MNCQFILLLLFILLLSSAISLAFKTGTIYKVQCQVTGKVYIGRTTVGVKRAMMSNISLFKRYTSDCTKRYCPMFELFVNNDYTVTILEELPRLSTDEALRKLHRLHLEKHDNAVNRIVPSRSSKERKIANRAQIDKNRKKYYNDNRSTLLQRQKEYRKLYKPLMAQMVLCEICGTNCTKGSLWHHKQTNRHLTALANLNSQSEPGVPFIQVKGPMSQKVSCTVCGIECTKGSLHLHLKSLRHLAALATPNQSTAPLAS